MISLNIQQKLYIGLQFVFDLVEPKSAYGREKLRTAQPFTPSQQNELQRHLDNIEKTLLYRPGFESEYKRIEGLFAQVKDIRKSIQKCKNDSLGEIDLFEIKCYLLQLKEIMPLFEYINNKANYNGIVFYDLTEALKLLDPELNNIATFHISNRYSAELARIREGKKDIEKQIQQFLFKDVPAELFQQRQNLVLEEQQEEQKIIRELSCKLEQYAVKMLNNADAIGELDLIIQKASLAQKYGADKPVICKNIVSFVDMLNPQVASQLQKQGKTFTPITIELGKGATLITGANMGGKSVTLATAALNIALIHYAFYPFAAKSSSPLFDFIHLLSGDLESKEHGLSSFGGQIIKFKEIIQDITKGLGCVLIDEFAHSTNPDEGAAIVQGITEYLNDSDSFSLLSTHYDKVAERVNVHYQIAGLKQLNFEKLKQETDSLDNNDKLQHINQYMDYNLVVTDKKQKPPQEALNICRLLGMPSNVIDNIKKYY